MRPGDFTAINSLMSVLLSCRWAPGPRGEASPLEHCLCVPNMPTFDVARVCVVAGRSYWADDACIGGKILGAICIDLQGAERLGIPYVANTQRAFG